MIMISPILILLFTEYPGEKVARKLTLVAKVLQNLANLARSVTVIMIMWYMCDCLYAQVRSERGVHVFSERVCRARDQEHETVH